MLACLAVATVIASLVIIWAIRFSTLPRAMYVSEFGAQGEATAPWFEVAMLLLVAGGTVIALLGRDLRSQARVLRAWAPAVSLLVACGFFLVASQVTCTAGCPLPVGPTFTWQDFLHTLCAVIAFAAACWGMLQLSFARGHRAIARLSLVSAVSVAVVAGAGGILSLARFGTDVGSWLELVATTIAIGWLAALGTAQAAGALTVQDALADETWEPRPRAHAPVPATVRSLAPQRLGKPAP